MRNIFIFFVEVLQDERDKVSSARTMGFILAGIGLIALVCGIAIVPFDEDISSRCHDAFKHIFDAAGPVVVLLSAGQAKSAFANIMGNRGGGKDR